jgi:3-oxoacyl-[acyl-carrier protein] reductase
VQDLDNPANKKFVADFRKKYSRYPSYYAAQDYDAAMFTKSLAREIGHHGITVNAVAPGFLETELTASMNEKQREQIARRSALQRLANVNDIAQAVAFLLSDKAANITGTALTVDAGSTA